MTEMELQGTCKNPDKIWSRNGTCACDGIFFACLVLIPPVSCYFFLPGKIFFGKKRIFKKIFIGILKRGKKGRGLPFSFL